MYRDPSEGYLTREKLLAEFEKFVPRITGIAVFAVGERNKLALERELKYVPEDIKSYLSTSYDRIRADMKKELIAKLPKGDANPFNHEYTKGWNDCIGEVRKALPE